MGAVVSIPARIWRFGMKPHYRLHFVQAFDYLLPAWWITRDGERITDLHATAAMAIREVAKS